MLRKDLKPNFDVLKDKCAFSLSDMWLVQNINMLMMSIYRCDGPVVVFLL